MQVQLNRDWRVYTQLASISIWAICIGLPNRSVNLGDYNIDGDKAGWMRNSARTVGCETTYFMFYRWLLFILGNGVCDLWINKLTVNFGFTCRSRRFSSRRLERVSYEIAAGYLIW